MLSGESYIHEYYYVLADGSRQRAPTLGGYTITDMSGREQHRWYVFIGKRSDLDRYKRLYGDDPWNVRPGRIGVAPSS